MAKQTLVPYFARLTKPSVAELIKALKKYSPQDKVFLAVDEEENATANDMAIQAGASMITFLPLNPQQNDF